MKVNLNIMCEVELTDFGEYFLKTNQGTIYKYNYNKETKMLKVELWVIMNIFGKELYNGAINLPFVKNEINILG